MVTIKPTTALETLCPTLATPALRQLLDERLGFILEGCALAESRDCIYIAEAGDDFVQDYQAVGKGGLWSDICVPERQFGEAGFVGLLEFIADHEAAGVVELLLECNTDACVVVLIPHAVLKLHRRLQQLVLHLQQPGIVGGLADER